MRFADVVAASCRNGAATVMFMVCVCWRSKAKRINGLRYARRSHTHVQSYSNARRACACYDICVKLCFCVMCLPCVRHVSARCLPGVCQVSARCLPGVCQVSAMCLPFVRNVSAMCQPCVCHVCATCLPCVCHVSATCLPCVVPELKACSRPDG